MGSFENHAVLIKPFTHPVWTTVFDAFLCDQFINSQPNARADEGSPDVAHSGAAGAVPGISRPTLPVWDYITFPQAMIAAANKGKGWHMMTAVEWAILAEWSRINGTMPHGGNANVNPPSDVTYTSEVAQLDEHLHVENAAYHRALPGTGPNTWSHNHKVDGVWDLQGLTWQWVMGLAGKDQAATEWSVSGQPSVLASTSLKYITSAFGRGTISGHDATTILTCDGTDVNWGKAWTVDQFNGMYLYVAEATAGAGAWYPITDTTATTITVTGNPENGTATFYIARVIAHDITSGMTSANKILTLEDADADLKPFTIPATSDGTGSATYGNDGYWFDKGAERAACRGGRFSSVADAGVFALYLATSPAFALYTVSVRACKCL